MPRPYNAEPHRARGFPSRPEINTPHSYPPYSQPTHQTRSYHPSSQHPSIQHQRHLPMSRNESPATRTATPDPQKSRTQIAHPPESASNFLKGLVSGPPIRPITGHYHPSNQFPQGSVEAVVPTGGKLKLKSGQDIAVIEAWHIIMSLKSGLHAESIWALNALTILLRDNRTVRQIILTQLPGLLNIIIQHYRFCLHELFGISKSDDKKTLEADLIIEDSHQDAEKLTTAMAAKCMSSALTLKIRDKQVKYSTAPAQLGSPYCKLPVKMIAGDDNFHLLLDTLWRNIEKPSLNDFLPISGCNAKKSDDADFDQNGKTDVSFLSTMDCKAERTEMTFEDMLSFPSFTRLDNHRQSGHSKTKNEKVEIPESKRKSGDDTMKATKNNTDSQDTKSTTHSANAKDPSGSPSQQEECSNNNNASHIQSCLNRFAWDCDVVLLEEEAAGFTGSIGFKAPIGVNSWQIANRGLEYVFPKQPAGKDPELSVRVLCLSNILRSLSCVFANHYELSMHQNFFSSLCGTLLLGHKHRVRCTKSSKSDGVQFRCHKKQNGSLGDSDKTSTLDKSSALSTQTELTNANEINDPDSKSVDSVLNPSQNTPTAQTIKSEKTEDGNFVEDVSESKIDPFRITKEHKAAVKPNTNDVCEPVTSVAGNQDNNEYCDPWWWDCGRQLREDSLVILANLSPCLDLAVLPGEGNDLAILDACLHWAVCPSADAQDPSPAHSAQSLGIEILTKLSMKESNVDLILATKPYSRLEKFLKTLTIMTGNRQNPVLREFAIVLLCNLCEEESCARAVALQTGAISNFLRFLEECEETGLRHQRVFTAGQEKTNCGTVPYMMQKCALILLKLARLKDNRPLFLKHQLRMVSLSMSVLLGSSVQSLISAVLFELSREHPNR